MLTFLATGLMAGAALGDGASIEWPECFCTDRNGTRHELGANICMIVDGRMFTARCEMAQNNPFWREQMDGCLSSDLGLYSADPRLDPLGVDAKV